MINHLTKYGKVTIKHDTGKGKPATLTITKVKDCHITISGMFSHSIADALVDLTTRVDKEKFTLDELIAASAPGRHILYETGDKDIPEQLLDNMGQVVLCCCKICGAAEMELINFRTCKEY